jgi:hypothetical protein
MSQQCLNDHRSLGRSVLPYILQCLRAVNIIGQSLQYSVLCLHHDKALGAGNALPGKPASIDEGPKSVPPSYT